MESLFWKNLVTFGIIIFMLLMTLLSDIMEGSPKCEIYSDGSTIFSCLKASYSAKEGTSYYLAPMYDFFYLYMLHTAFLFLFACFLTDDFYQPYVLRYFGDIGKLNDYKFDDLIEEVQQLIKVKTDMKFVMRDATKHLLDVLHMITHGFAAYMFSFYYALSMGYTTEEAAQIFPLVKKCTFDHWPFQAECRLGFGTVFKAMFIILWLWYVITSLIIIAFVIVKIRKCLQARKNLKEMRFTKMEDWLIYVCQENIVHLNRMSRFLRMKNFQEAAKLLVLDPNIRKYCPKLSEVSVVLKLKLSNNTERIMVVYDSWV